MGRFIIKYDFFFKKKKTLQEMTWPKEPKILGFF